MAETGDFGADRKFLLQDRAIWPKILAMPRNPTALKLAIVTQGRTQRDVAAEVGMNEVEFSRIVNGHRTPSVVLALSIAAALGSPVENLWPERNSASDQTPADSNVERLAA